MRAEPGFALWVGVGLSAAQRSALWDVCGLHHFMEAALLLAV